MNALSEEAELFYRRLMSVVDDYGRCEADPDLLRVYCFPRRLEAWPESRVASVLQEVSAKLVKVYAVDAKKYLEIINFNQRSRSVSKFPPSDDGHMTVICQSDGGHMTAYARATSPSPSTSPTTSSKGESEGVAQLYAKPPAPAQRQTETDVNPKTGLAKSVESEFSAIAEGMYSMHPKSKDWPLVPAAVLRALERTKGDGEMIRYVHGLWCKTEGWREQNARYCPALPKWLDDRGWEQIPDEFDYQYRKWSNERTKHNEQTAKPLANGSGRQQHGGAGRTMPDMLPK